MKISPALDCFSTQNLVNGFTRPYLQPNTWTAGVNDDIPVLTFEWEKQQTIKSVTLFLDTDFDHPMESSQMGHPEDVMPFVVRDFSVFNEKNEMLFDVKNNHQTIVNLNFSIGRECNKLIFRFRKTEENVPVSVFQILINSSNQ